MSTFPERLEKLHISNITLRDCFDPYSTEFTESTIESKISTLRKLIEHNESLDGLLQEYASFYTSENKPHVVKDIHLGLKYLINHLLKPHTNFYIKEFDVYDQADLLFVLTELIQNPNTFHVKIKTVFYKQLVQKWKAYTFKTDDIVNPSMLNIEHDEHLNAWAYWCGNLDADTILIGQDFGDAAYYINNKGKDEPGNPTNLNLQILFKQTGIELNDIDEDNSHLKLYFTNAVLGAKTTGGMAGQIKKEWYKDTARRFTKELIEIINPKSIIAMGSTALDALAIIYNLQFKNMKEAVQQNPHKLPDNRTLYVVYHCSKLGQVNRKFEEQKEDWRKMEL